MAGSLMKLKYKENMNNIFEMKKLHYKSLFNKV